MTEPTYDLMQTAACNAIRARLQSIAILAVEGQQMDPSGDPLADQLDTIAGDLAVLQSLARCLNRDDVQAAYWTANDGKVRK